MTSPLVSCLCVTQPGREDLATRAVFDFFAQDHTNSELIIVTTGDVGSLHARLWSHDLPGFVAGTGPDFGRVTILGADHSENLGTLRNRAMARAEGEYLVQWDDDDRYHHRRVSGQLAAISPSNAAVCLSAQLYYFVEERQVYYIDWRKRLPRFKSTRIPGTILVRREIAVRCPYPTTDPFASKGEDGKHLEATLVHGGCVALPDGELYLRQFHGNNTWDSTHFRHNAAWMGYTRAELEAGDLLDRIEAAFRDSAYVTTPGTISVVANTGDKVRDFRI